MVFPSHTQFLLILSSWWSESCSVLFESLHPHGLYSPWNSPGQNTGVRSLSLLQGIFPTQGSIPGLPHCRQILYQLSHRGSPRILEKVADPFSSGSSQPRNQTRVSCTAGGFFTNWAIVWEERWFQVSIHPSPDTDFIFFFFMEKICFTHDLADWD